MTSSSGTANNYDVVFFLSFFLSFFLLFIGLLLFVSCLLVTDVVVVVVFKSLEHLKTTSSILIFWNLFYLAGFRAKLFWECQFL